MLYTLKREDIIFEEILHSQGHFRTVRRWIKGWVEGIGGQFINGNTGRETVIVLDVVTPTRSFHVVTLVND